jgi:hypothetical protein
VGIIELGRVWGGQGMRVRPEGPQLISQMIRKYLNIDCSVLMGANIAKVGCFNPR